MKNLNHFVILFILLGSVCFTSCDKEDDVDPDLSGDIVGSWSYESSAWYITINGKDIVEYFVDEYGLTDEEAEEYAELYEESMVEVGFDLGGWTFNEDGTIVISSNEDGDETGTWSLSSDKTKLTMTFDGETGVINVVALTDTRLELSMDEEFDIDIDQDGQVEEFDMSLTIKMVR